MSAVIIHHCLPRSILHGASYKHPVMPTIDEQMHLRFNVKQPKASHSSNIPSLCPAPPFVTVLQAN